MESNWPKVDFTAEITSNHIIKVVGFQKSTFHYFHRGGAVVPDIEVTPRPGVSSLWSMTNLVEWVLVKNLMGHGVANKAILEIMAEIREGGDRDRLNPRNITAFASGQQSYLLIFPKGNAPRYKFLVTDKANPETLDATIKESVSQVVFNLTHVFAMAIAGGVIA